MDLSGKRVAIVGLGASGLAAARLCMARGAKVVAFDESKELRPEVKKLGADGAGLRFGALDAGAFDDSDLVVVSPGVPPRAALDEAEARGCEVISEVELASRFITVPIVLVGGTNGKSTVTALAHRMIEESGIPAFIGGNFGTPVCEAVGGPFDVVVIEISSFQAERVPTLRPQVNVLLNISEDHLDRYESYAAYAKAKGNPFANMTEAEVAIIPEGDAACAEQVARGRARLVTFGADDVKEHMKLRGRHNRSNASAAVAVARQVGATDDGIRVALLRFGGLPHRHELIEEIGGVFFYDDSKATNVGAAVAALTGLEENRAVLIAGGKDKMGDYAPLVAALRERGRALVLIGEAAQRIADASEGAVPIHFAETLEAAVTIAADLAEPGDAVLLSPACSSYDMFKSFKARGLAFQSAVRSLGGAA